MKITNLTELRAVKFESALKRKGIAKYNKRWRSWSQNRIRQYRLATPTSFAADLEAVDDLYVIASMNKAASLRKHDLGLWASYAKKLTALMNGNALSTQWLGHLAYAVGKSSYLNVPLMERFHQRVLEEFLPKTPSYLIERWPKLGLGGGMGTFNIPMSSHACTMILWVQYRLKLGNYEVLEKIGRMVVQNMSLIRPEDFVKIGNILAFFGVHAKNPGLALEFSQVAVTKFEETTAQQIRNALNVVALSKFWSPEVASYLLQRFTRIWMTCRPTHLWKAYYAGLAFKLLHPRQWDLLDRSTQKIMVSLSMRHIPMPETPPRPIHWEISQILAAQLGIAHRNKVKWGPFTVDLAFQHLNDDDSRDCLMVDLPQHFYTHSSEPLESRRLEHLLLTALGWNVRRIPWFQWLHLDSSAKQGYLEGLLNQPATDELKAPFRTPSQVKADLEVASKVALPPNPQPIFPYASEYSL